MSVTGYTYNINATKKLGEVELKEGLAGSQSWHHQYKDSAYIYVGGLHQGLTEGDVVIVFSQFGEIVDINVVRDKSTGKSKGFAFVCYEDQRSTILAVDNLNGAQLLNRTLRVDHVSKYKAPKNFDEEEKDEDGDPKLLEYKATGAEGKGHRVYNAIDSQKRIMEVESQKKKVVATEKEDEDEAWAKSFEATLIKGKKKKDEKRKLKEDIKELKRMKKEAKLLKLEIKKAKLELKKIKSKDGGAKKRTKSEPEESDSSSSNESSADSSSDSSDGKKAKKVKKEAKEKRKDIKHEDNTLTSQLRKRT